MPILQAVWNECGCTKCQQWKRSVHGATLCRKLIAGEPIADELHELLYAEEPLEWNRLPVFRLVTTHLLTEMLVIQKLAMQDQAQVASLSRPKRPMEYHVYCSLNNAGALELLLEMAKTCRKRFHVNPARNERSEANVLSAIDSVNQRLSSDQQMDPREQTL